MTRGIESEETVIEFAEYDKAWVKVVRRRIDEDLRNISQGITSLEKWLLASLLAINGGAMIAIVNSPPMPVTDLAQHLVYFLGGIILAISSAMISIIAEEFHDNIGFDLQILTALGQKDQQAYFDQMTSRTRYRLYRPLGRIAKLAQLGSLIVFSFGILTMQRHLSTAHKAISTQSQSLDKSPAPHLSPPTRKP